MPQNKNNNPNGGGGKKKKKGRKPKHQNTFAFRHNPKSKMTAKILSSPISSCCTRCQQKLEWRKKYRKYKPLSQPATCNICHKRNIKNAYHTICQSCCISSDKAVELLNQWNNNNNNDEVKKKNQQEQEKNDDCDNDSTLLLSKNGRSRPNSRYTRVCAICVKEPANNSNNHQEDDDDDTSQDRTLRLREIKTIQRQQERELASSSSMAAKKNQQQCRKDGEQQSNDSDNDDDDDASSSMIMIEKSIKKLGVDDGNVGHCDDNDPLLKAVGGSDKHLTGAAYQETLLLRKQDPDGE